MKLMETFKPLFAALISVFLYFPNAFSELGEPVKPLLKNKTAQVKTQLKSSASHTPYTVQTKDSDGTSISEYVGADGIVFAVAWCGLVHPDPQVILGTDLLVHRKKLSRENPRRQGKRMHRMHSNRLVEEKWGSMRNLCGRVYLPHGLPDGVTRDDIK